MASATDLTGRLIKFELMNTPVEFEITSCKVRSQGDISHYQPSGTNSVKRSVPNSRLISYDVQAVLLTANLPWPYETLTQLDGIKVTIDRSAGSPKFHTSTDAVVGNIEHDIETTTHQVFSMTVFADGNYTPPT